MNQKPRIGVLFLTSAWFREVGLQGADSDTTAEVGRVAQRTLERLRALMDPVYPGLLFSVEEARRAGQQIRAAGVDGLLLCPLMWCEDQIVRAALEGLRELPLLLWTFSPWASLPEFVLFQTMIQGSGPVCTLQLSGMLRREGYSYRAVVGHAEDPEVYRLIGVRVQAMAARRRLERLRVGVLPFPCAQMSTTYVDEFALRARYGVELRYLEVERLRGLAREVGEAEIRDLQSQLEREGVEILVDRRNLEEGARYALALEKIMRAEGLAVLAMNDVIEEMHGALGLRPCLTNRRLSDSGAVVSMEADVAAGVGMYLLRQLTGANPFYSEVFSVDYGDNALLLGHAGYHDSANRDPDLPVKVVPDVEYQNTDRFTGAVTFFKYRPGPVTVVNTVWDGEKLKWVAFQGESLPGPFKMDGNCHLYCRAQPQVPQLLRSALESGVSQHWAVVPAHLLGELSEMADALDIRFLPVR